MSEAPATIAIVGSSISSQLVDLDIADIAGAFSVSADQASWIACAATMTEAAGIPADGAGLFNVSRIVGRTFGTGSIAALIRYREDLDSAVLVEGVNNANSAVAEQFNDPAASFLGVHGMSHLQPSRHGHHCRGCFPNRHMCSRSPMRSLSSPRYWQCRRCS